MQETTFQTDDVEAVPGASANGANGSPIPFDNPSSTAFLGKRLIVANQSYISGNAADQALLSVYVGEEGAPEYIYGLKNKKRKKHRKHHKKHHHRKHH